MTEYVLVSLLQFQEPIWWKAGAQIFSSDGLNYLGKPNLIHAQSIIATLACQVCFPSISLPPLHKFRF